LVQWLLSKLVCTGSLVQERLSGVAERLAILPMKGLQVAGRCAGALRCGTGTGWSKGWGSSGGRAGGDYAAAAAAACLGLANCGWLWKRELEINEDQVC